MNLRHRHLHPIFAQMLDGMAPAPTTPPKPPGYDEYTLETDVGELISWLADENPVKVWLGTLDITPQLRPWALRNLTAKADAMRLQEIAERNESLQIERAA